MEYFDGMIRQKCGLLTEEQRSMLKYRKVGGILQAEQRILNSGVAGASELAETLLGVNPVKGMLELQRSAQQAQLRAENPFDRTMLPLANEYSFGYELPVDKILAIIQDHIQTAPQGIESAVVLENIIDAVSLEIGEDNMEEMIAKKEETGRSSGDPIRDMLVDMKMKQEAGRQIKSSEFDALYDKIKDSQERTQVGFRTLIAQGNEAFDDQMVAEDKADLEGFRSKYKEHNFKDLDRVYHSELFARHGKHPTPQRKQALEQAGLQAPTNYKNLTREERYLMFERLWGLDYQGALDALDAVALGRKPTTQMAGGAGLEQVAGVLGEAGFTGDEQERNIQQE